MIYAILISGTLALVFALLLSIAMKKLDVEEDPKIKKVYEALPKNNCGGCGFASCEQYAKAVVKDPGLIGQCVVGGEKVSDRLSEILGAKTRKAKKKVAHVHCCGGAGCEDCVRYHGVPSCASASRLGGYKSCSVGCLGFGDCVSACKFNALTMNEKGYPEVDIDKCVGCGACVKACPNGLITLQDKDKLVRVACSSHDKKKAKFCKAGCIGCGICEKSCPEGAITMKDNLPVIDYDKCTNCMTCVERCPRKVIKKTL